MLRYDAVMRSVITTVARSAGRSMGLAPSSRDPISTSLVGACSRGRYERRSFPIQESHPLVSTLVLKKVDILVTSNPGGSSIANTMDE